LAVSQTGTRGTITDVVVMTDRDTGRCRGFGFVTFDAQQNVDGRLRKNTKNVLIFEAEKRGDKKIKKSL